MNVARRREKTCFFHLFKNSLPMTKVSTVNYEIIIIFVFHSSSPEKIVYSVWKMRDGNWSDEENIAVEHIKSNEQTLSILEKNSIKYSEHEHQISKLFTVISFTHSRVLFLTIFFKLTQEQKTRKYLVKNTKNELWTKEEKREILPDDDF